MTSRIPLLVTMDLEIAHDHDLDQQHAALTRLRRSCAALDLPMTVFCTADAADEFADELHEFSQAGHEIACHGVTHGATENFRLLSASCVEDLISRATDRLGRHTGKRPLCFRGPSMTTSTATQRALVRHGYAADFSVCPQRLDFFRPRGGTPAWLTSPRRPYHPSARSPFRRGNVPLLVIPLSSLGLPFLSGILYLLGLRFMKSFFRSLLREAAASGTAIVYLFHSYEFAERRQPRDCARSNAGGPAARTPHLHRLYLEDREARYAASLALLDYMRSHQSVAPTTGARFAHTLNDERST